MLITLREKSKIRFVLRTCRKEDYAPESEEQWEKSSAFVLAIIFRSCDCFGMNLMLLYPRYHVIVIDLEFIKIMYNICDRLPF